MQRDMRAFLWDVREAALAIQNFTSGLDAEAYTTNELVQSGVERKFEVMGEALNQLAKADALLENTGPAGFDVLGVGPGCWLPAVSRQPLPFAPIYQVLPYQRHGHCGCGPVSR